MEQRPHFSDRERGFLFFNLKHDFMFELTKDELIYLRSQIATSSWSGIRRTKLYVFLKA